MKTSRTGKSRTEELPAGSASEAAPKNVSETDNAAEADNLETMALFAAQIDSRTRCSRTCPNPAAGREARRGTDSTPKAEAEPAAGVDGTTHLRR